MQIEKKEFKDRIIYGYWKGNEFIEHRDDGPAVEWANGTKYWFIHGKYHREDGPAVEWANGTKRWYFHGKLHRENGPAVEFFTGQKFWYLEGNKIKEKDFEEAVNIYKVKKICK